MDDAKFEQIILNKSNIENLVRDVKRLDKRVTDMEGFNTSIILLNKTTSELSDVVKKLSEKVNDIEDNSNKEKAQMYDKVKWIIISGIIGAILTLVLTQIGLK